MSVAISLLDPLFEKFPYVSAADMFQMAGVVAVEHCGGPRVLFRGGRVDTTDPEEVRYRDAGNAMWCKQITRCR